jgi:hypothetical protein
MVRVAVGEATALIEFSRGFSYQLQRSENARQHTIEDFIPIVKIKVLRRRPRAENQTRAGFSGLRSQSKNAGQLLFSHPRRSSIMLPLQPAFAG